MAQKITHLTPRAGSDAQLAASSLPAAPPPVDQSLDATLPPTPLKKLLAADGAAVYVLSNDSGLVDAITTAGGDQFPIQVVPTFKALRSAVDTRQCRIALLDAEPFGNALRARIAELKAIEPELVVLVAAPREVAEALMGLFSERVIHRLLIKPPAIGITRLLLESAVSRYLQIREAHDETVSEPLVPSRRTRSAYPQGTRSAWFLATALVIVLVAGVLIGGFWRGGGLNAPESSTTADSFAPPIDAPPTAEGAVVGASIATGTTSDAAPDSGLAGADPPASTAAESVANTRSAPDESGRDIGDVAASLAGGVALAANATDESVETAPDVAGPGPSTSRAEPGPISAVSAAVIAAAAAPTELDSLLSLARARMERGQMLEPSGDSARDYVARAFALDNENPEVLAIRGEVGAAVADSARVVLGSGQIERASTLTEEARRLGAPAETLALLSVDIAAAREAAAARAQEQSLATGIERMEQGQLVAPENDSAMFHLQRLREQNAEYPGLESAWGDLVVLMTGRADKAIAEQNWPSAESWIASLTSVADPATVDGVRADLEAAIARLRLEYLTTPARTGELRVLTVGQARYPDEAQRRGISGWVETEFIVGTDGVPREARVVEATPPTWFEEAALAAVALYRYEPFERDGLVYERLARVRVRFDLR